MSNFFQTFIDAVVNQLGNEAVKITTGKIKALIIEKREKDQLIEAEVSKYSKPLIKILVLYRVYTNPDNKKEYDTKETFVYVESKEAFNENMALEVKEAILPGYSDLMFMSAGWIINNEQKWRDYYIENGIVWEPTGPVTF